MNTRAIGNAGEDMACEYLKKRGWTIVDRNVRCGRNEIDIIARKRRLTAFIEVKRRKSADFGRPAEAVNRDKQARIVRAAIYLQENDMPDAQVRFDVIEILPGEIRHIEDAFDASNYI